MPGFARAALVVVTLVIVARGARADTPAAPPPSTFEPGLASDLDLVLLPAARRPPPRPMVTVATRAQAPPDAIGAVLLEPAAFREALPALIRADVIATRPGARPEYGADRLLAWEVEIPLFNLAGKAWLTRAADTVDLVLVEGAFAPGRVRFRVAPTSDGAPASVVTCELSFDARAANWIFRRVARHDPWSETAMTAATAWVLARAVALRAELAPGVGGRPGGPVKRPRAPIVPPAADALDGARLGVRALAPLRAAGVLGSVRRAPSDRLAWVSVAVALPGDATSVAARLAAPETWRVFPGWGQVTRVAPATESPPTARPHPPRPDSIVFAVKDNVAFVDLDATWSATAAPPARATAIAGDIHGAVLGWDIIATTGGPAAAPPTSVAVLSTHPHLDASGYVARRIVAAEPLMEHALALALAYADAAAIADSFR